MKTSGKKLARPDNESNPFERNAKSLIFQGDSPVVLGIVRLEPPLQVHVLLLAALARHLRRGNGRRAQPQRSVDARIPRLPVRTWRNVAAEPGARSGGACEEVGLSNSAFT